jgi:hypothetical protein
MFFTTGRGDCIYRPGFAACRWLFGMFLVVNPLEMGNRLREYGSFFGGFLKQIQENERITFASPNIGLYSHILFPLKETKLMFFLKFQVSNNQVGFSISKSIMYHDFTLPYPLSLIFLMGFSMIFRWVSIFKHNISNHIKNMLHHIKPYKTIFNHRITTLHHHIQPKVATHSGCHSSVLSVLSHRTSSLGSVGFWMRAGTSLSIWSCRAEKSHDSYWFYMFEG